MNSNLANTESIEAGNFIHTFARSQLRGVNTKLVLESSFLLLATCGFFYGAANQLAKQSELGANQCREELIDLLVDVCELSEHSVLGIVDSLDRLSKKFYLIENIIEQGKEAADQWLCCDDAEAGVLSKLVNKYRNLSMFELGLEGVNQEYDEKQQQLYSDVDASIMMLRRRTLVYTGIALCVMSLGLAALVIW